MNERTAKILHTLLTISILIVMGAFSIVRWLVELGVDPRLGEILRYAVVIELLIAGAIIAKRRSAIPFKRAEDDADGWWARNGPQIFVLWVLAEGAALTGAVFWLLTGDPLILIAIVVATVVLLLHLGPSRWLEGQ